MRAAAIRLLILVAICSALSGCVYNRAYRTAASGRYAPIYNADFVGCDAIPHDQLTLYGGKTANPCAPFYQTYIEFDEFGQMWDDGKELQLALDQITYAKQHGVAFCNGHQVAGNGSIRLVVFVHGWKNNASEKSGNVVGFRDELGAIARQDCDAHHPVPVVGIYIGWRGDWVHWEALKDLVSYWNRRNVAQKLPGAHLTEVLNDLEDAAHREDPDGSRSQVVLVGHSFGAQVLERAITPIMVQNIEDQRNKKPGSQLEKFDLVILVNPAAPAIESVQMLTYLKAHHVKYCPATKPNCSYADSLPLIVTLKSEGDWATGFVMWAGQRISLATESARDYSPADALADSAYSLPPDITNQRALFSDGPVSVRGFRSHVVYPCRQFPNAPSAVRFSRVSLNSSRPASPEDDYCMAPRALNSDSKVDKGLNAPWNDTPFWIAELPVEIVPDHTTVFGPALELMINALISERDTGTNARVQSTQ